MPTVYLLGTFDGIKTYCFNGKYYTGKFVAHLGRQGLEDVKRILEAGHAQGLHENSYSHSVLIASKPTWDAKVASTPFAGTWGDLCWLHYWHPTADPYDQSFPAWAKTFNDYGHLLIHEYADGKVAFMKPESDLYAFFVDAEAPVEHPSEDIPGDVNPPENQPISAGDYVIEVDFKIGNLPIVGKVTIKQI